MTWRPGEPVLTPQDHAEWETWRRERKREQQRQRRAMYWRVDYYPDRAPAGILREACERWLCGAPQALDRILAEWAEAMPPE
jgi:hypothetical protein